MKIVNLSTKWRSLFPALTLAVVAFAPINAIAEEIYCEVSGGGTTLDGDTFILNNIRILAPIGGPGSLVDVSPTPRPLVVHLTGESPPRHLTGSPYWMNCAINGVNLITIRGTGRFRGTPVNFDIRISDRVLFNDAYAIWIYDQPGFDSLIYHSGNDLADGDVVTSGWAVDY